MNEELMEKARQLRAAGVPVEEIEKYLQSKMQPADDTVEVEAGYPERLATTILKGAQVIPGMKSFQALAGSIGSKFTDTPVSYSDAKAGLEEQTDRMGTARGLAAEVVSSPVMAPVMAARGLKGLSAAKAGAAYGGASAALDYNPDETLESRLFRTGASATGGAMLGKGGSMALKLARAPSGTAGEVLKEAIVPDKWRRAASAWEAATEPQPIVKPSIRLNEGSRPKVEGLMTPEASVASEPVALSPRRVQSLEERLAQMAEPAEAPATLEGFLGNSIDNLQHAGSAGGRGPARPDPLIQQLEDIIAQSGNKAPKQWKPRHASNARFEMWKNKQK